MEGVDQFEMHITICRVLGFAEPRIPWDANRLHVQRRLICWIVRTSATSLPITVALLPNDAQAPPPPRDTP